MLAASIAAFDATDFGRLGRFFDALPSSVDHVLVTGPGPCYTRPAEFDLDAARRDVDAHLLLPFQVARDAAGKIRPGGTMLFVGGTGGRRPVAGLALAAALVAALPAMVKSLAPEIAPVRVNLIATGFAATPGSASRPGGRIDESLALPTATLPIGRGIAPASIAALAVHLMTNTVITGATIEIEGGQDLIAG